MHPSAKPNPWLELLITVALPARRLILDGEVIGLRGDGRPLPFQVTRQRIFYCLQQVFQ